MLMKNHEIPLALLKLAALKRRLPTNHHHYQRVVSDWSIYRAGYRGELALDYYLHRLNHNRNYMIHDVRLRKQQTFQMDTIILNPNFFLIIEVKNISGSVNFDHAFGQMTRTIDGKVHSFQDPIVQVETQAHHLQQWLLQSGMTGIPIETLVVFVNNHVQLNRSDQNAVDPRIIHVHKLADTYEQLNEKYTKNRLSHQELQTIGKKMIEENKPLDVNVLEKYQLTVDDIEPGVICPACETPPMQRKRGYWKCESCGHRSQTAHLAALQDFHLLFDDQITNKQARWLFQIDSRKIARSLLQQTSLQLIGKNKGASYQLDYDPQRDFAYLLT